MLPPQSPAMECHGLLWQEILPKMKPSSSGVVCWPLQWIPGRLKDEIGGSGGNYQVYKLSEMVFKDHVLHVHMCIFIEIKRDFHDILKVLPEPQKFKTFRLFSVWLEWYGKNSPSTTLLLSEVGSPGWGVTVPLLPTLLKGRYVTRWIPAFHRHYSFRRPSMSSQACLVQC